MYNQKKELIKNLIICGFILGIAVFSTYYIYNKFDHSELVDYASEETKKIGFELIKNELLKIPNEKVKTIATENIEAIKNSNRRDFRF